MRLALPICPRNGVAEPTLQRDHHSPKRRLREKVASKAYWLEQALRYAEQGRRVFPLRENSKKPILTGGFNRATSDQRVIEGWAAKFPNANVGIATGRSDMAVPDIDPKNGGQESFNGLVAAL